MLLLWQLELQMDWDMVITHKQLLLPEELQRLQDSVLRWAVQLKVLQDLQVSVI